MDGVFNKNDEKPCHALARKIRLDKSKSPTKERDAVSPARSPLESKVTEYGEIERKARKLKLSKILKKCLQDSSIGLVLGYQLVL